MSSDLIQIGRQQQHWNAAHNRILKYYMEIFHKGLNEHKLVSAPEEEMLENKVNLQIHKCESYSNFLLRVDSRPQ